MEEEGRGWIRRMEIYTESLDKITRTAIDLKRSANVALGDIKVSMLFIAVVIIEILVLVSVSEVNYWVLVMLVIAMICGTKLVEIKMGEDLLRINRKLEDLFVKQDLLYLDGERLLAEMRLAEDTVDFAVELKAKRDEFEKYIVFKKCVKTLPLLYWAVLFFFSTFSIAVPILLQLNLDTIVRMDALALARAIN